MIVTYVLGRWISRPALSPNEIPALSQAFFRACSFWRFDRWVRSHHPPGSGEALAFIASTADRTCFVAATPRFLRPLSLGSMRGRKPDLDQPDI